MDQVLLVATRRSPAGDSGLVFVLGWRVRRLEQTLYPIELTYTVDTDDGHHIDPDGEPEQKVLCRSLSRRLTGRDRSRRCHRHQHG